MPVDVSGCACKCVCTQVFTGLYVQNGERQADCIFEAAGVRMSETEEQELQFNQDGQMGSGKFAQSLR